MKLVKELKFTYDLFQLLDDYNIEDKEFMDWVNKRFAPRTKTEDYLLEKCLARKRGLVGANNDIELPMDGES